ncbi:MAG: NAD(P)-binding domain-containing protein [Anaerolineae bacterium]|nr:NAD(P)-binding domain-containing protein [Anaerolineae bacterium]
MDLQSVTIGAIGLGQMGGGISENLARAGYRMLGFDPKPSAQARLKAAGGEVAEGIEVLVDASEIVLLCVPGQVAIQVTEDLLIPLCREGQIVIDHSTVPAPRARAMGARFAAKGVRYMDVPVSGGAGGATAGRLRMFAGGDREVYDLCWPLFEVAGNPAKVHHYGPVGMGQVAKVVQQLTQRLPAMARLEVMAFGLRGGLGKEQLMAALDVDPDSGDPYAGLYRSIEGDSKRQLSLLASEWAYYLEEAESIGMRMPMLEGAHDLVKDAEKTATDVVSRPMPCLWDELMKGGRREGE